MKVYDYSLTNPKIYSKFNPIKELNKAHKLLNKIGVPNIIQGRGIGRQNEKVRFMSLSQRINWIERQRDSLMKLAAKWDI